MTDHLAKEAARLLNDEVLTRAMDAVRREAQDALCVADPTDHKEISRLQAIANCLPEVRNWLNAAIMKAQPNGFDPNEPTREEPGS